MFVCACMFSITFKTIVSRVVKGRFMFPSAESIRKRARELIRSRVYRNTCHRVNPNISTGTNPAASSISTRKTILSRISHANPPFTYVFYRVFIKYRRLENIGYNLDKPVNGNLSSRGYFSNNAIDENVAEYLILRNVILDFS